MKSKISQDKDLLAEIHHMVLDAVGSKCKLEVREGDPHPHRFWVEGLLIASGAIPSACVVTEDAVMRHLQNIDAAAKKEWFEAGRRNLKSKWADALRSCQGKDRSDEPVFRLTIDFF